VNFQNLISTLGLKQIVNCATHESGNILDLIMVKEDDSLVITEPKSGHYISDHCFVCCTLSQEKPGRNIENIEYRKLKNIDEGQLRECLRDFSTGCHDINDIDELADMYNKRLKNILDELAPLCHKEVAVRECVPWYDNSLVEMKKERRKL
jgi:hypothetical protein